MGVYHSALKSVAAAAVMDSAGTAVPIIKTERKAATMRRIFVFIRGTSFLIATKGTVRRPLVYTYLHHTGFCG